MTTARGYHTATLLNNGKVLIAGGFNPNSLASAELYDPNTGTFTATGSMSVARNQHKATLLNDGTVLIAGGVGPVTTAELYDPGTGTFTVTNGSMNPGFYAQTATLLNNGQVLATGAPTGNSFFANAQLYDPITETFADTGSMATAYTSDAATLLNNGQVLITGGIGPCPGLGPCPVPNAELYDPVARVFNPTGNMLAGRWLHTSTLLTNGDVLVIGGTLGPVGPGSPELYLP